MLPPMLPHIDEFAANHAARKRMYMDHLVRLADAYMQHRGIRPGRMSDLLFRQGMVLTRLRAGGEITMDRLQRGFAWFDDNWPDDLRWPRDIPRGIPKD